MDKVRILICDDQALIRDSLSIVLEKQEGMDVVGEAANGKEAVAAANALQPDIILMDIRMPEMDGIEATREILKKHPQIQIIVLTTFEEDELISECLSAGAAGYLLKDMTSAELVKAIGLIRRGESILPRAFMQKWIRQMNRVPHVSAEPWVALTDRELEVLQYLLEGLSNKELAQRLFLSETTVKNHLSSIFAKLGVRDRTQAVLYAVQHGLVKTSL
jgi:DNA-binding NarL/FixJ family response regulator